PHRTRWPDSWTACSPTSVSGTDCTPPTCLPPCGSTSTPAPASGARRPGCRCTSTLSNSVWSESTACSVTDGEPPSTPFGSRSHFVSTGCDPPSELYVRNSHGQG